MKLPKKDDIAFCLIVIVCSFALVALFENAAYNKSTQHSNAAILILNEEHKRINEKNMQINEKMLEVLKKVLEYREKCVNLGEVGDGAGG